METKKPRCSGTMTEAAFFSWIVSALRHLSYRWKPREDFLKAVRRPYKGTDKRIKYEYPCKMCKSWFKREDVVADHIIPCGKFRMFSDAPRWLENCFVEIDGYQSLCRPCHLIKTNAERQNAKH